MQKTVCYKGPRVRGKFKGRFAFRVCATAALCAPLLLSADSVRRSDETPLQPRPLDTDRIGLIQGLSSLVGKKVRDINEHSVGKLEDVLVDLPRGEVLAALVSPGGNGVIPVPPATFHSVSSDKVLVKADHKIFDHAPRFVQGGGDGWATKAVEGGAKYFQHPAPEKLTTGTPESGRRLLEKTLAGSTGETLGRIQDLMVDLPVGRAVYLVVQPTADTNGILYLVPPSSVKWQANGNALTLAASKERFLAGPHFSKSFSTDMVQPELATSVYHYYTTASNNKPADGPAPVTEAVAPAKPAAASRTDAEITKAVMLEILNEGKVYLRGDVQITTRQGRVKLGGVARNEKEKGFILEAVKRVVAASFIDDALLVKGKNTTARVP